MEAWTELVVREAEWDEVTRNEHLGNQRHDHETCSGCGLHASIRNDPENNPHVFDEHVCAVCKARAIRMREIHERDEAWLKTFGKNTPSADRARPTDGLHVSMRPATPEDIEKARQRAGGGHG